MTLRGYTGQAVEGCVEAVAEADRYVHIRMFTLPKPLWVVRT